MLGLVGMIMGVTQAEFLPQYLGLRHPLHLGHRAGRRPRRRRADRRCCRASSSPISACRPSSSRWAACWSGAAAPGGSPRPHRRADGRRRSGCMGGGIEGSIGANWSWVVALIAFAAIVWRTLHARAAAPAGSAFPLRPVWAEVTVAGLACARRAGRSCWSPTAIDLAAARRRADRRRAAASPCRRRACRSRTASPCRC